MMVTNSMPTSSSFQSTAAGKISHARSDQGVSQTNSATITQQGQTNAHITLAGFRLNTQASSAEARRPDASSLELHTEDTSDETLLGNTSSELNLATRAQALMKGISKEATKQGDTNQLAQVSANNTSQSANMGAQAIPMLTATAQENQSGMQASALNSLKVSASDLQTLLNQPAHGQVFAANTQSQTPAAQHSNPTSPLAATQAQGAEWAAVRVDTSSGRWGEQMMQVLQDRVTLQAQQNLQEAKIRLDPPELGKLDLLVRVEGDRLSVQINANTAATREALMQVSERLRTELQEQNFIHVDVNVGSDRGQERHSHDGSQEEATVFAARETNAFQSNTTNYSEHWLNTQA
ncbi:flagellar hook-length control protein FliK [Vibrio campbellii]|uniref:Flagellar hook-length control protein FliK n=1 Tax=Vibrio campbellii TaxID=680 RepID=A0ABY5IHY1_9VIBR|nr:flagellar hook-length control protein FliK [Vibrio campbellii]UTZ24125.1 flagellar hook-length control protein FliK [Vibrio campbellii]UTZ33739.1 flagellar hook-length control protein FliK [Vibrio campbellii]